MWPFTPKSKEYVIDCLTLCGTPHRVIVKALTESEALKLVREADYIPKGVLTSDEVAIAEKFHKEDHIIIRL